MLKVGTRQSKEPFFLCAFGFFMRYFSEFLKKGRMVILGYIQYGMYNSSYWFHSFCLRSPQDRYKCIHCRHQDRSHRSGTADSRNHLCLYNTININFQYLIFKQLKEYATPKSRSCFCLHFRPKDDVIVTFSVRFCRETPLFESQE